MKRFKSFPNLCLLFFLFASMTANAENNNQLETLRTPSAPNAEVYFIEPNDGDTVSSDITVKFGLKGMGVAPAGKEAKHTGHHHLLINVEKIPDLKSPLPASDNIRHFGGGQTETDISLAPGKHTLQLLLANHLHIPHDPPVISKKITITVE